MSLYSWFVEQHPFFRELRQNVLAVTRQSEVQSFDDLVVRARRPSRTVLLALDQLVGAGDVTITAAGITSRPSAQKQANCLEPSTKSKLRFEHRLDDLPSRYISLASKREAPALLYGQRRLVPESAVERCLYILNWLNQPEGTIVFLGDDDLVSPIVASAAPGWTVHVVDIDNGVLEAAQRTAEGLGTRVLIHHGDLSQIVLDLESSCDVAVSDPFPSGDGSFEGVFWSHVARILRPGGVSVTTLSPSHKPLSFAAGALQSQQSLGLCLMDLRADFGRYEAFEFEYTPFEQSMLKSHGLVSTIAFTKSLMAARKLLPQKDSASKTQFDFSTWSAATLGHYLTQQAGVEKQRSIAQERGFGLPDGSAVPPKQGLKVELLLPPALRQDVSRAGNTLQTWTSVLGSLGASPSEMEVREIVRLSVSADVQPEGPLAQLGLAIRALESWERWRLDQ